MNLKNCLHAHFKAIGVLSFLLCLLFASTPTLAFVPDKLSLAKKDLRKIYTDNRVDFYCGCPFDKDLKIMPNGCSYQSEKNGPRSQYIDWEHIVPVSVFGAQRLCWQTPLCTDKNGKPYKGRLCCKKIDPLFVKMESDLHNLVPAVSELNMARSNYSFGDKPSKFTKPIANCALAVDKVFKKAYPPEEKRGEIARAYLYFEKTYDFIIPPEQKTLFELWNSQYPESEWEKTKNARIKRLQWKKVLNKITG